MKESLRHPTLLRAFRTVAHLEAVSWTGLLVGMSFERIFTQYYELGDQLVAIFGSIHGGLVIAFGILGILVARERAWPFRLYVVGFLSTWPPFATLWFDAWAYRKWYFVGEPTKANL